MIEGITATSSSVGWNGVASRVIDGNTGAGNFHTAACASTRNTPSWIKLDLNMVHHIDRMEFVGRSDGCPEHSSGWNIYIGNLGSSNDQLCKSDVDVSGGSVITIECDSEVSGQYITMTSIEYMVLCEVEVYGEPGRV